MSTLKWAELAYLTGAAHIPWKVLLSIDQIASALEKAWAAAPAGRECCELSAVLRELHRILKLKPGERRRPQPLRLFHSLAK
jgi:hypothetical protein